MRGKILRIVLSFVVLLMSSMPVPAQDGVGTGQADSSITIAVIGDLAGKKSSQQVSDLIIAQGSVKAVLIAGDTCNTAATPLGEYGKLYKGTYDRILSILYPCPGNHDKRSIPPFSGYCSFWKEKAHAPDMYYSFDLGGWHFVSLNSEAFHVKGKDESAANQIEWLRKDLAARPGAPVIAYWHRPLFSKAKHCGDGKMKPFWDVIHAHGPALVFNGHNHVYERYDPLDSEGKSAAAANGIQEFVIGPGSSPDKDGMLNTEPPVPAVFHDKALHVGFFTLAPDGGYKFTIKAITDGKIKEVDTGSGRLVPY
ncbi:MAG: hypothetical protein A2283_13335 [Lentisphaerae bacterium RIFOXYA12_FULL_48_11]|nr:MAG: hypothetical protein A2283_13335 [Lentisphaerae bacterium RIFOXYA12_FULL_48_11]